jgi:Protein of unknown function (DUF3224)
MGGMSTSESMKVQATGTFNVDSWQDETFDEGDSATLGRARLTKTFAGDIVGTSAVEMLAVSVPVDGSPEFQGVAYVAVERITARVHGRSGSFALTHSAGAHGMSVTVVPGSAGGELRGLTGDLTIARHEDGTHNYVFDYRLD